MDCLHNEKSPDSTSPETLISQKEKINKLLEHDLETRGNLSLRERDFLPFSALCKAEKCKIILPRAISTGEKSPMIQSEDELVRELYKRLPFLINIPLEGLFIAGGYISSILFKRSSKNNEPQDLDIFVCGYNSIEAAEKRIKCFIHSLNVSSGRIFSVTRSKHALTIRIYYSHNKNFPIQIILRLYSSPSEVLHGFDLGSSMIGLWDSKIYTTLLGSFSLVNRCNIINLPRRSTTYEIRLVKYFNRGFDIIFPKLDIRKLGFGYNLERNPPTAKSFRIARLGSDTYLEDGIVSLIVHMLTGNQKNDPPASDYSISGSKFVDQTNFEMIVNWNDKEEEIPPLIRSAYTLYSFSDPVEEAFSTSLEGIDEGLIYREYGKIDSGSKTHINPSKIEKFFPGTSLDLVYQEIKSDGNLNSIKKTYIKINIEKVRLIEAKNNIPVNWIISDPGTQLCGSFNPDVISEEEWYNNLYFR